MGKGRLEDSSSVDNFECQCKDEFRSACKGLPYYADAEGKRYCVLHYPRDAKEESDKQFQEALDRKYRDQDFDFAGVYFPSVPDYFKGFAFKEYTSFLGATFSKDADFSGATFSERAGFSGATFSERADFSGATFSERAGFSGATFSERADFSGATFSELVGFSGATFSERADFSGAIFSERAGFSGATFSERANFSGTTFSKDADFSGATFTGRTGFSGASFQDSARFFALEVFPRTALIFSEAKVENPERISFHTTYLRPSWFVDVDAQKFDFSDVEWFRLPNGDELSLEDEVEALKRRKIEPSQSLRKLARACRRLMNNAEENRDYPTANEFHYWSMEAQRKEGWSRLGLIATLYWALSGYGERPLRALEVLIAMYAVFAVLYMLIPSSPFSIFSWSDVCEYLGCIGQAATYSLSALARLLPAEPKLSPGLFQFLVTVEGLLGPLQIALLLLAVRRKVMR